MQAGDVAVFREEHVAALATEVQARLGNGEGVAGGVAADDQGEATDVALGGAAEALDAVGRGLGGSSSSRRRISWPMRKTSPKRRDQGSLGRSFR